ncbi:AMP-binding protein [Pseudomonas sp. G2-4]|uniref:AMP-binding protein n=1 Tax=Pseudomonas sp. G2-4 TaxID=1506334 RepID=UPI0024B94A6B|nr:AMP-binding protein [Pseudomonas sp. G2-4]WHS61123.1 AMP-binding protein [Pseudomonas sp. G2-4]
MNKYSPDPEQHPTARVQALSLHVHDLLKHAAQVHAAATVTSVSLEGTVETQTYAQLAKTAHSCAMELHAMGLRSGEALVSFGFSSLDQMAWLYAALRQGVATHFLNPQHHPEDLGRFLQQLRPSLLLHDAVTGSAAQSFAALVPGTAMREMARRGIGSGSESVAVEFAENTVSHVCYSSGTTGVPKVVEYTHRSTVLHAWACALPDAMGLNSADRVMPLMQNFHASAWGAPFVCPLVGASLVLVPPHRDPAQWFQWIETHRVTVLGAVSAHWLALVRYMRTNGLSFSTLRRTVVGGTRLPFEVAQFIQEKLGVEVCHAWGMTETSPLATIERFDSSKASLRHGKPVFGIELAVQCEGGFCSTQGTGELMARGHWVAHSTANSSSWLATGDFATLHENSELEVIDRMEDSLIADGIPLSSALVEHQARLVPGVADAALLVTDVTSGRSVLAWVAMPEVDSDSVTAELEQNLSKTFNGWRPTQFTVVDAFPYTASAKVQKHLLKDHIAQLYKGDAALTPTSSC